MARGFGQGDNGGESGAGDQNQDTPDAATHRHTQAVEQESREILLQFTNQEIERSEDADELKERFPVYIEHLECAPESEAISGDSHQCSETTSEASPVGRVAQSDRAHLSSEAQENSSRSVGAATPVQLSLSSIFGCRNGQRPGEKLRELADRFAQTEERAAVRVLADEFDLSNPSRSQFLQILTDLFKDGNSNRFPERIVVLCVFCSDIFIRSLRLECEGVFQSLFCWSLKYINSVVERYGGWGRVFGVIGSYLVTSVYVSCAVAVTIAAVMYIRRRL